MPDTQHGTWACLPLMCTWAAMWGHGRDDFCGGNNWVLRGFRGVYTELSEPWIFQCCFVAGPVVVLRIFQGWMQQASLAQEHNYPSSETAPLSARGVQRELLGFTGADSALGTVLWMSQCRKNDITFKLGTCWMFLGVYPSFSGVAGMQHVSSIGSPSVPQDEQLWFVPVLPAAGTAGVLPDPGSASRAELVTCGLLCSEAAKTLVFSVLINRKDTNVCVSSTNTTKPSFLFLFLLFFLSIHATSPTWRPSSTNAVLPGFSYVLFLIWCFQRKTLK